MTVDHTVQRAGAGRGTFYLCFDSKAAVFQAVLDKLACASSTRRCSPASLPSGRPPSTPLQGWFEEYVDLYQDNRAFLRAIHEARAVEPDFTDVVVQQMTEDVGRWPLPGFPPDANNERLRRAALMGYVLAEGIMYLWLVQGFKLDRALTTRVLAEQFHAALQGVETPANQP